MTHFDIWAPVGALTGRPTAAPALRRLIVDGNRLLWPRSCSTNGAADPARPTRSPDHEAFVPAASPVAFGTREAAIAADLCARMPRARRREINIAIAACAIVHGAASWSLNEGAVFQNRSSRVSFTATLRFSSPEDRRSSVSRPSVYTTNTSLPG